MEISVPVLVPFMPTYAVMSADIIHLTDAMEITAHTKVPEQIGILIYAWQR